MIGVFVPLHERTNHRALSHPIGYVVQECGCWEWVGAVNRDGYGCLGNGKGQAHRAVYQKERGRIPEGLHLDHLCRNPRCVRPDHLEPVTPRTNSHRGAKAKLSAEQVTEIKQRYAAGGVTLADLGSEYGVHGAHLSRVVRRDRGYWDSVVLGRPPRNTCVRGHDWADPENTLYYTNREGKVQRFCRACKRIRRREHKAAGRRAA